MLSEVFRVTCDECGDQDTEETWDELEQDGWVECNLDEDIHLCYKCAADPKTLKVWSD